VCMFDALLQQTFNLEAAGVYVPLGFGLAVGLAYVLISSAMHRRKK
jgi:hypothetical protein